MHLNNRAPFVFLTVMVVIDLTTMRTVNPYSATHCSAKSISCVKQFALSFVLLIFSMNVFQSGNQICTDAKEIKFTITSYCIFFLYFELLSIFFKFYFIFFFCDISSH